MFFIYKCPCIYWQQRNYLVSICPATYLEKKVLIIAVFFLYQGMKVLDVDFYSPSNLIRKASEKYFTEVAWQNSSILR